MSMMSEVLVLGALGSVVLGPKKMAKLAADISRVLEKLKTSKNELAAALQNELSMESSLPSPKKCVPVIAVTPVAEGKDSHERAV